MAEGGHDGAWYCSKRPQFNATGARNFCPPEGCPVGTCAAEMTFEQAWAIMEAKGYRYGPDALEQVRFGWDLAHGRLDE